MGLLVFSEVEYKHKVSIFNHFSPSTCSIVFPQLVDGCMATYFFSLVPVCVHNIIQFVSTPHCVSSNTNPAFSDLDVAL